MRALSLVAVAAGAGLGALGPTGAAGQDAVRTDQVQAELTLSTRAVSVSYAPTLRAADPAHSGLLSEASGVSTTAVRVGRLEGHRSLEIGSLRPDPEEPPESGPEHDVWLARDGAGWALEARPAPGADPPEAATFRVPLEHAAASSVAEAFTAGLVPTGERRGRLLLHWGDHRWRADFELIELSPSPPAPRQSGATAGISLTRDSDTSARYRAETLGLGERDETALLTPAGARIQVLFQRGLEAGGPDHEAIGSIDDGAVVQLTRAAAIRLRTEASLQFGALSVPTGNLTPDFAGAYSLWIKRAGAAWSLVFNDEADSWGSQHDPAFDAGEVALTYGQTGDSGRPLGVALVPIGPDEGRLMVHWGSHEWSADFEY